MKKILFFLFSKLAEYDWKMYEQEEKMKNKKNRSLKMFPSDIISYKYLKIL